MSFGVALRITVEQPPPGVSWAVQSGRSELIEPSERTETAITFDVAVRVGVSRTDGRPTVLGPVTQGSPTGRFLYLNSGSRAGQPDSCWDRRAKVPLTGINRELIDTIRETPGAHLEARIAGTRLTHARSRRAGQPLTII